MAKDKKGFLMYADQRFVFDKLPDDLAGKLIKHLFSYVNDESPKTDELIIDIAFEPIKQQLKRDLSTYNNVREKRSEAGKKSAEVRKQKVTKSTSVESVKQNSTKLTDSVNDNVTVNVNDKVNVNKENKKGDKPQSFNFKQSLIDIGVEKQITEDWMKVRAKKKASNTKTAFSSIKTNIDKSGLSANECIKMAVEKDWRGFEASWLNNSYNNSKSQITPSSPKRDRAYGLDCPSDGIERKFYIFKSDGFVNRCFSDDELKIYIERTGSEMLKSSSKRF